MMNYSTFATIGLLSLSLTLASCSGRKGQNGVSATDSVASNTITTDQALHIDTTLSYISWRGFKPGGEHFGKLPISSGVVNLKERTLYAGAVVIRMNGISVEDLKADEGGDKLNAHIESEDFFDVEKYPEARFELTGIPAEGLKLSDAQVLHGNLTLKGVTKNIAIPIASCVLDINEGTYTFTSSVFTINRADWGVKYGSKSFFTGLGDKFINDDIELSFVLVTRSVQ